MFANIFGDYLIRKGAISESQFFSVKEEQAKTRVKLGLIAVSEKMITEKQADEINRKQAVMDKRFGDIAVELGYLTNEQVGRLLSLQGNPYMLFTQTISDLAIMTVADVESALADFQKENGFTLADIDALKSGDIDRIVPLFLPELNDNTKDLICVALRTMNRLITTNICVYKANMITETNCTGLALQNMNGDTNVSTCFAGSAEGMLVIADAYAGETFDALDLDALDSAGEFVNIINGLYATALSGKNVHVELLPPTLIENNVKLYNSEGFCQVPLLVNRKSVSLMVSVGAGISLL